MKQRPNVTMHIKIILALCGFIFLIVARVLAESTNTIFILDASGSMWGQIGCRWSL